MSKSRFSKNVYLIISILSIIALAFSIIILIQKTTYSPTIDNFCTALDSQSQCLQVQGSAYGKILGIDNPWYGIVGFLIIIFLAIINYFKENWIIRRFIVSASIIAGSWAIYFLYLQRYVIGAYCIFCVIVDIISIIMLLIAFYITYKEYDA